MWEIVFLLAMIIVGVAISQWDSKKSRGGTSHRSSDSTLRSKRIKPHTFSDDSDVTEYLSRTQKKRDKAQRKKQEYTLNEWYDDYETYTDEDGNEHSLDYDDYCDECDDYHEE